MQKYLSTLVKTFGGVKETARVLGVSHQLVYSWFGGDRIVSAQNCIKIEKLTAGEVTCEQLRPDIEWSVLRGSNNG